MTPLQSQYFARTETCQDSKLHDEALALVQCSEAGIDLPERHDSVFGVPRMADDGPFQGHFSTILQIPVEETKANSAGVTGR